MGQRSVPTGFRGWLVGQPIGRETLMVEGKTHDSSNVFHREGLLNHASSAEEFRDVQKVLSAGGAGHGDDSSI